MRSCLDSVHSGRILYTPIGIPSTSGFDSVHSASLPCAASPIRCTLVWIPCAVVWIAWNRRPRRSSLKDTPSTLHRIPCTATGIRCTPLPCILRKAPSRRPGIPCILARNQCTFSAIRCAPPPRALSSLEQAERPSSHGPLRHYPLRVSAAGSTAPGSGLPDEGPGLFPRTLHDHPRRPFDPSGAARRDLGRSRGP